MSVLGEILESLRGKPNLSNQFAVWHPHLNLVFEARFVFRVSLCLLTIGWVESHEETEFFVALHHRLRFSIELAHQGLVRIESSKFIKTDPGSGVNSLQQARDAF